MENLYKILGIGKGASQEGIKKAYRKKVKELHPDKGGNAIKFQEVQFAYDLLSNKEKREIYDSTGSIEEAQSGIDKLGIDCLARLVKEEFDKKDNKDLLIASVLIDVHNEIKRRIMELENKIKYEEEREKSFQTLRKRIKTKRKKQKNVIREVIDGEINYCREGAIKLKQNIKIYKKALQCLDYYEHDFLNLTIEKVVEKGLSIRLQEYQI